MFGIRLGTSDKTRARRQIQDTTNKANVQSDQLKQNTLQPEHSQFFSNYQNAANKQQGDYSQTMGGYQDFASTGGFTPQNIQDMRARSIAPMRATYANAMSNMDRNRSIQGGYSPNFNAASAKMSRNLGANIGAENTNINAGIGEAVQRGKLSGLGGASSLYGTSPGMASTFGNQALQSSGQLLDANQVSNQAGQAAGNQMMNLGQMPSNFDKNLSRIGGIAKIGAGIVSGFGGGAGAGKKIVAGYR